MHAGQWMVPTRNVPVEAAAFRRSAVRLQVTDGARPLAVMLERMGMGVWMEDEK